MANEPTPQPDGSEPESSDEVNLGVSQEQELDAMLLEASSLATELAKEGGVDEAGRSLSEAQQSLDDAGDVVTSIDAQLSDMEDLLQSASNDLGLAQADEDNQVVGEEAAETDPAKATAEDTDPPAQEPREASSEAGQPVGQPSSNPASGLEAMDGVTDLLADEPAAEQPAESHEGEATVQTSGSMDLTQEDLSSLEALSKDDAVPDFGSEGSESKTADTPVGETKTEPTDEPVSPAAVSGRGPWHRLEPALLAVCSRGVAVLDQLDKPLRIVPPLAKKAIGCLALATLGVTLIALLISRL